MAAENPHSSPLPEGEDAELSRLRDGEGLVEGQSLLIGLGNPILGDDGVGWRVAEEVRRLAEARALPIEVDSLAVGGLALMERMVGYDRVVIVDAIRTGSAAIGDVTLFSLADIPDPAAGHLSSGHDANLHTALAAGRALGAALPTDVSIVAIEAEAVYDFEDSLTPEVEAAIPRAVEIILRAFGV